MAWNWEITTGKLRDPIGKLLAIGYSGSPAGINNPAMQEIRDVGPIPCGLWTVGAPYEDPKKGPFTMALTPSSDTNTFGRDEFRIHGDRKTGPLFQASEGCIILPLFARQRIWESDDHQLEVVVTYVPLPVAA